MIAFSGSQHLEEEGQDSQEWEGGCSSASPWFSVAHDSLLGLESSPDALPLHGVPGQQSVSASVQAHPSCPVLLVAILFVWLVALVPLSDPPAHWLLSSPSHPPEQQLRDLRITRLI